MLDFHNHMIPGVDDGSESIDQSLVALGSMLGQGITHVIATPHFRASVLKQPEEFAREIGRIDAAWDSLHAAAMERIPTMTLGRGVELALDDPDPRITDPRICLAKTHFVLVEFPYLAIPPNSERALARIRAAGLTPIVAHPERYNDLENDLRSLVRWKESGAFLQLNAGSLAGAYGARVAERGWRCLERGLIDFLSSDYHARGKCLTEVAERRFAEREGTSQFRLMTRVNGERLLAGLDPLPVPRLERPKSRWQRLGRALRFGR